MTHRLFAMMIHFQKTLILCLILLGGILPLNAQEAIDLISQASCECITEMAENGDATDAGSAVEICIQQAIFANLSPIMEEYDFNLTDEVEATRIGEQIGMEVGMKLVADCPSFMTLMMNEEDDSDEDLDFGLEDFGEVGQRPSYETLEAVFNKEEVTKGGFSYLLFTDEYGEKSRYLWLQPFSGDELIGKTLEGKTVVIEWESLYIRNGKDEEYQKTKVIRRLYD